MIVTVTANTSMDYVYMIPTWEAGKTLRASRVVTSMGGKPTDASYILGEMGIGSLAIGFSAGMTGEIIRRILESKGVTVDFLPVNGESRRNLIIAPQDGTAHTAITAASLEVDEVHIAALREQFTALLDDCEVVVLGGTLPKGMQPSFYTDFIAIAREKNVPVVFDAGEPNLSAGLQSRPTFCKPNRDELSAYAGREVVTVEDAYQVGCEILEKYGTQPIISLGSEGGLAVLEDAAYRIPPLNVPVVNAAGAGDAILAGITASIYRKQPIEQGLKLGFGAASAVVTTEGTAECSLADIEKYAAQIELIPYPAEA